MEKENITESADSKNLDIKETQSQGMGNLITALCKAKKEFKTVPNDGVSNRNKYATITSIVETMQPILSDNGLCVVQYAETDSNKLSHFLVTKLFHVSGAFIESRVLLLLRQNDCQGIGAAMTYMKRYQYCSMLGLVSKEFDEDDDGESTRKDYKGKKTTPFLDAPEFITKDQHSMLTKAMEGATEEFKNSILKKCGVIDLKNIPYSTFKDIYGFVLKKKEERQKKEETQKAI